MIDKNETHITEDEAALYDRQIRLWGLDAQRRLRGAKILLIGIGGLGAEIAKNIVLAGIKTLTILDSTNVNEEDFVQQFFLDRNDLGKNRAECSLMKVKRLNPMVEINVDIDGFMNKPTEFFDDFDVVCATCCSYEEFEHLNNICREKKIYFFAGNIHGYYGYMFADLLDHEYATEEIMQKGETLEIDESENTEKQKKESPKKKQKKDDVETKTVKKVEDFCSYKSAVETDWSTPDRIKALKRTSVGYFLMQIFLKFRTEHGRYMSTSQQDEDIKALLQIKPQVLKKLKVADEAFVPDTFAENCFSALSPVCAVVGGVIAQEIIKAVSKKDQPHNNWFFFDGNDSCGMVEKLHS